jgi:hypothetical protein
MAAYHHRRCFSGLHARQAFHTRLQTPTKSQFHVINNDYSLTLQSEGESLRRRTDMFQVSHCTRLLAVVNKAHRLNSSALEKLHPGRNIAPRYKV